MGATHEAVLKALTSVRGNQRVTDQNPEAKFQSLEKYGKDLTELARSGKLDPVIGRDEGDSAESSRSPLAPEQKITPSSSASPALEKRPSSKA